MAIPSKAYHRSVITSNSLFLVSPCSSVWSSLYPPIIPDVTSQAYAFPTTLHTITTTQTLKGITHKSILCMSLSLSLLLSLSLSLSLSRSLALSLSLLLWYFQFPIPHSPFLIPVGEHTGHIASIPKRFLDPRRSVEVTDVMK